MNAPETERQRRPDAPSNPFNPSVPSAGVGSCYVAALRRPSLRLDQRRPFLMAVVLAGVYFVAGSLYIVVSSKTAVQGAGTVEELARVELLKGLGFIAVTSVLLFALAAILYRRLGHIQRDLSLQRERLLSAEADAEASLLAATIAHDLRNVLTVLQGHVDCARESELSPEGLRHVAGMEGALADATALIERLRARARKAEEEPRASIDVGLLVRHVITMVEEHPDVSSCHVELTTTAGLSADVRPALLAQAVTNLVVNAAQATGPGGRILVSVTGREAEVAIDVEDDGPGVPIEQRRAVFRAFETTKATGTGLGLYSVCHCAQRHGGRVKLDDSPLGGARFCLLLPLGREGEGVGTRTRDASARGPRAVPSRVPGVAASDAAR